MDGLWEGLPASPISAASTEQPSLRPQTYSPPAKSSMHPKRHLIADPSDGSQPWKRNRTAFITSESNSHSGSGSIEFVEAKSDVHSSSPGQDKSKDERRKALLLRLQAIERMKKNLCRQSPRAMSEDDLLAQDKADGSRVESPNAVQSGPSSVVPATLPPKTRKNRAQQRARSSRGREANASSRGGEVVIVDDDTSTSSSAKRGRGRPSRGRKSTTQRGRAVAVPTRTSSRVRRPRVLEAGQAEPNNDVRVPTPTCMTKCKRFQFCKKLTTALVRDPAASFFAAPVKELWPPEAIPNYFDVIANPMDLRTVKRNLEFSAYIISDKNGHLPYYFDVDKYSHDMRLIFRNAMEYNKAGDMLYNSARAMLNDFDRKMRDELPDSPPVVKAGRATPNKRGGVRKNRKEKSLSTVSRNGSESSASDSRSVIMVAPSAATPIIRAKGRSKQPTRKSDSESSEPVAETKKELLDRLNYLRRSRSAVLSRTPVPKGSGYLSRAALLYNVMISHSQKRKCAEVITQNKVPSGKMVALIDMVRGAVTAGDDEDDFELEFDRLDNKMWRNVEAFLEQYVPGFKTIRQSTLGREFSTVQQVDQEVGEIQHKLRRISNSKTDEESDDNKAEGSSRKETSFFSGDAVDDSSSESESDSESDSSDDSDSDDE